MPPEPTAPSAFAIYLMFAVNIVVLVGGIGRGVALLIALRDELRDVVKAIGVSSPAPGTGLLGDMLAVRHEISSHRDTLIEVAAELGLRRPGGRT